MPWYSKYLSVFEVPFDSVQNHIFQEVRENVQRITSTQPVASVVVIAHNEETRLLSCLWSLSENKCDYPIELIGIDNSSVDRTADIFNAVGVKSYMEEKKSPGYARLRGLQEAKGKYYICIDADTIYPPYYLQTIIKALKEPGMAGVYSLWSFIPDGKSSRLGIKVYEALRDFNVIALSKKRPELNVRGMAFAYVTDYGRKVGFKVNIRRGEDGSMALGLKHYGRLKLITDKKARVITSPNTLNAEGTLYRNFKIKFIRAVKNIKRYFVKKDVYIDRPSNLIPPANEPPKG